MRVKRGDQQKKKLSEKNLTIVFVDFCKDLGQIVCCSKFLFIKIKSETETVTISNNARRIYICNWQCKSDLFSHWKHTN